MATTALSGHTGSITGSGGTEIKKWAVTVKTTPLEATSMASAGWQEFIEGLQGATGSFDCIGTKPTRGVAASLSLLTASGGATIAGKALIHDVQANSDVAGVVGWTAQFTFTGAVTGA
jgi:hypothetical protein